MTTRRVHTEVAELLDPVYKRRINDDWRRLILKNSL